MVKVGVDTEGELINLFEVKVSVPESVDIAGWNKDQSLVNIWVQEPAWDRDAGVFSFLGGVPGGFRGRAVLLNLEVKPRQAGTFELKVDSASKGFVNDGLGTEVQVTAVPAVLQVSPGKIPLAWWSGGVVVGLFICAVLWKILRTRVRSRQ